MASKRKLKRRIKRLKRDVADLVGKEVALHKAIKDARNILNAVEIPIRFTWSPVASFEVDAKRVDDAPPYGDHPPRTAKATATEGDVLFGEWPSVWTVVSEDDDGIS